MSRKKKHSSYVFESAPVITMGRSRHDLSHTILTTMNVGDIVPLDVQEIYPGDTFRTKTAFVARTSSPYIRVPMDSLVMDLYYFFVPNRLVYDKWEAVMGENTQSYWAPVAMPDVPIVKLPLQNPDGGPATGTDTIASYLGINIGLGAPAGGDYQPGEINALPFRGYALIYNEWFRSENLEAPVYINTGDWSVGGTPTLNLNAFGTNNIFGQVAKANKLPGYFESCLPQPQKGTAVDIPITAGMAHVVPGTNKHTDFTGTHGMHLSYYDPVAADWLSTQLGNPWLGASTGNYVKNYKIKDLGEETDYYEVFPDNMYADVDSVLSGTINDLRFAVQLQKLLEKDARIGTRYVEYLYGHFGTISPDARLQRPEFLGGKRVPLQVQQITQTSASTESSPMAQVSAYSLSSGLAGYVKGFVEHGFVFTIGVIRQAKHTYQQGIERFWFRKSRYDYYDPVFANIGEQPVYKREIYADSYAKGDMTIFGYNEAWADLRYRPSKVTGAMNSVANNGLDVWHFGDEYANAPTLNKSWLQETPDYVDRALSVPSSTAPQFIVDFYQSQIATRVLPVHSIPGLVDHH